MNVMIPFTGVAGLMTYAWPFAKSEKALIAITVIYGFSSGSYVSLLANPMMDMGDTGDVGRRVGMFMTVLALGALAGPPISGAIWTASGGQTAVGYYAGRLARLIPSPRMRSDDFYLGTMVLIGVGTMCCTRHLILKRMFGKI